MAIIKCPNGHYYDDSRYSSCPICAQTGGASPAEDSHTVQVYGDGGSEPEGEVTVSLGSPASDDERTIGEYSEYNGTERLTGWLVCVSGASVGADYRLFHGWNRIGRSVKMDVCVPTDRMMSLCNHASVVYDDVGNKFYLVRGDGVPTALNGEMLSSQAEIRTGDRIRLGSTEFVFIAYCEGERKW